MYLIKLYRGKKWTGIYYEIKEVAYEGWEKVKGTLGNPLVGTFGLVIELDGTKVAESNFDLAKFNRAELVELTVIDEKILDSVETNGGA